MVAISCNVQNGRNLHGWFSEAANLAASLNQPCKFLPFLTFGCFTTPCKSQHPEQLAVLLNHAHLNIEYCSPFRSNHLQQKKVEGDFSRPTKALGRMVPFNVKPCTVGVGSSCKMTTRIFSCVSNHIQSKWVCQASSAYPFIPCNLSGVILY